MKLADPARMTVSGDLGERLARAIEHLKALNQPEMRRELAAPDAKWHWGADYMGRWLGTMALLSLHTREDYGVTAVAEELLGYQRPDGSFGAYGEAHDYQEWFGMGRALVGLLDYHTATGEARALDSAARLGDYFVEQYPSTPAFMRECYASGLEGIVGLAGLTGHPRYWETARRMAAAAPAFGREWISTRLGERGRRAPCGGHVHCQVSTARGLLELHRLTGEAAYLEPVLALHDYITCEALWISGGVGFYFNRPEENEACADADWVRLNLALWQLTGKATYLDLAENALVNQLFFAQLDSGAFCYLRGLQNRGGAAFDVCCSHHAPRAMWEVMRHAFTSDAEGVWVNLLVDGAVGLPLDGASASGASLTSQVSYAADTMVLRLGLRGAPADMAALKVRVPGWAGEAEVRLNGQPATVKREAGYVRLERAWRDGDQVEVRYPRRLEVIFGQRLGRHVLNPNEAAVRYGPHLYCVSDRWNSEVNLPLARVRWSTPGDERDFVALATNRLETSGIDRDGQAIRLVLSPLHEVGGTANGIGRSHPVSTSPFRVWLPLVQGVVG